MKRSGIMMIEFLVYLVLFALLSTMTASWISRLWGAFMLQSRQRNSALLLYSAHDYIACDIRNCINIASCQNNRCVLNTPKGVVEWLKEDGKLYRKQGAAIVKKTGHKPHAMQKKITSHVKSIVAHNVESFICTCKDNSISIALESKPLYVENTIILRNRTLLWKKKKKKVDTDQH